MTGGRSSALGYKVHTKSHVLLPANPANDQEVLDHTRSLAHSRLLGTRHYYTTTLLTTPFTFAHVRGHGDDTPTPPTLSRLPHHLSSNLQTPLSTTSLLAPPHPLAIQHLT